MSTQVDFINSFDICIEGAFVRERVFLSDESLRLEASRAWLRFDVCVEGASFEGERF